MKQYRYRIDGADYEVQIENIREGRAAVRVNGIAFDVEMVGSTLVEDQLPDAALVAAAPAAPAAPVATETPAPQGAGEGTAVKAPLPGVVTAVKVQVGQAVKKGDTVVVLEAMKMENNITAESDGTVTGVAVSAGQSVLEGTVLVTIA
ncbi:MAG: biotin/lipoyl-binding protein [Bacteroidaceae bacterium]|nr:biotin/lipoyl-binding protein [Bacteroidaceae bacterium]